MKRQINWDAFANDIHRKWHTQAAMDTDFPLMRTTATYAFNGRPVGATAMLRICEAMGIDPRTYLEGK